MLLSRYLRRVPTAALLGLAVAVLLVVVALTYEWLMREFEGRPRTFLSSLQWASETLTSTGYGGDARWQHPLPAVFAIVVQFLGVGLMVALVPMVLVPLFESRFETRIPRELPELDDFVFIYRHGETVDSLYSELAGSGVPVVVFEEDEATARRLRDRGVEVVLGRLEEEEPDLERLSGARAVIVNGEDDDNALMVLSARSQGYDGKIYAFVQSAHHRSPMMLAGATAAYMPYHVLAGALVARASDKIGQRVSGLPLLGGMLSIAEMRVHADSELAGQTLASAEIRARTGANVVGIADRTGYRYQPHPDDRLEVGSMFIAVGSEASVERLGELATPLRRDGDYILLGYGVVGRKVAELLREAGESVRIVDREPGEGVDVVGDALDPDVLKRAGIHRAKVLILALDRGSPTMLAAMAVRSVAPNLPIIARVNRSHDLAGIHRAGVDFALSTSQVSSLLLSRELLGEESVGVDGEFKIASVSSNALVGQALASMTVQSRTGCVVVAVRRDAEVLVDLGAEFVVEPGDQLFVGGSSQAIAKFSRLFAPMDAATSQVAGKL